MIKLFCAFCNNPISNFGIHDFDNKWYCSMLHYHTYQLSGTLNQPKDFVPDDKDYNDLLS